ncbi:acyltransferase family protein [Achromobacter insuavis]
MLRTLLALSVVLDHLGGGTTDWLVGGRLAVQLFYVISGFLISYVLTATDHYRGAPGRFYANRALRLYPVYLAVAALTLLAYLGGGAAFWRVYDGLPLAATLFLALSNLLILGQDWLMFFGIDQGALAFTGSFARSDVPLYQGLLVPQAWTLGVEMSFYLIAPYVLHSPRRLLVLLAASLALRAVLITSGIGLSDPWTYRFFPTELALFLAGTCRTRCCCRAGRHGAGAPPGCPSWAPACWRCTCWSIFPSACRTRCATAWRCCCSRRCCRWPSCSSRATGWTRSSAS